MSVLGRVPPGAMPALRRVPGIARLYSATSRIAMPAGAVRLADGSGYVVTTPQGTSFVIDADAALANDLAAGPTFVQRVFESLVEPGGRVLDVGAAIGVFTVLAARRTGPSGRVVAFEPVPKNVLRWRENVRRNDVPHAEVVAAAVGDRSGTVTMYLTPMAYGHSLAPVSGEAITVPMVRIDDALDGDRFDVVKIDAEGVEPLVFSGMTHLLDRSPEAVVFLEYYPSALAAMGHDPEAFLRDLLARFAYLYVVGDDSVTLLGRGDSQDITELATPRAMAACDLVAANRALDFGAVAPG